jgi:Na+-driven multidrug efflux pump
MMAAVSVGVGYNIVNAGFIGSLHSTALLAALTFGLPVFALLMAVGGVFGTGGGTAVSRLLGELETTDANGAEPIRARIKRLSAFTVWGSVIAGIAVAAAGLLLLGPIVGLLGADASAAGPTALYVGSSLPARPCWCWRSPWSSWSGPRAPPRPR